MKWNGLKRTPLKRGTKPLKRTGTLKKTPLRKQSPQQAKRLRLQAKETKRLVLENNYICPKCGRRFSPMNPAGQHHVVPRGVGGSDSTNNKQLECMLCHQEEKGWMTKMAQNNNASNF